MRGSIFEVVSGHHVQQFFSAGRFCPFPFFWRLDCESVHAHVVSGTLSLHTHLPVPLMGRSRVGHKSNCKKKQSHHSDHSCCSSVFEVALSSTSDGIQRRQHGSRRFGTRSKERARRETVEHEQGKGLRTIYVVSAENQDIVVPTARRFRNAAHSRRCPRCTTLCLLGRCFAISAPCLFNTTTDNHHPRCHVQVIQHLARSLHLSLSPWEIGTAH